jgi:glutaminase
MTEAIRGLLESVYADCVGDRSGEILRGIPALEDVDPESFGISMATTDGYVYEVGETRLPFCIQSISKPFTYGIALTDRGSKVVDAKIDVEPSGELYNEISLHPTTHRPRNPMINAGALVAASLVGGLTPDEQAERIRTVYSAYAGRELTMDPGIFASQLKSGHRNRAIGHMLREFGVLEGDPNEAHEVYLRACSTMIDCRDLSVMGATLANGGVHPVTGEIALAPEMTERVLSVMATCGMYDAAGAWFAKVGMPAKSGVGGGIVAVLPGQIAIAAFSPRLDEHGNSVRAFQGCRQLSRKLELHSMHVARGAHSAVRDVYDILEAPSSLQRPMADRRVLEQHGHKARIYELHGDLLFAGAESVLRAIGAVGDELELLAADVRRISDVAAVSRQMLLTLRDTLREQGCEAFLVDPDGVLADGAGPDGSSGVFDSVAAATVFFEDRLVERYGKSQQVEEEFRFHDHPALADVPPRIVDALRSRLAPRSYENGDLIVAEGDSEAGVVLIMRGRVRSSLRTASGATRSLATLVPGTCFGDVYVVTGNPHPLTMHAEGPVEALELTREEFAKLTMEDTEQRAAILNIFMYAIHDDLDRSLRALGTGRISSKTAG